MRAFERAEVIGVKEGILEQGIWKLKDGGHGWGMIFARIVLGHLYTHPDLVDQVDAIIPMPAFLEPGQSRQGRDHTGYVIERAIVEDTYGLPLVLDPPLIRKTRATQRMRDAGRLSARQAAARDLEASLVVPDEFRVRGRNIMVYDDVFTGGNTLNAVARVLRNAGAHQVFGLVLARAQWL